MKKTIILKACILGFSASLLFHPLNAKAMNSNEEYLQNIENSEMENIEVGQIIETSDNLKYKVLSFDNGKGTVQFGDGEHYLSYDGEELTIPEKIIYKGMEFEVTEIASRSFTNMVDEFSGTINGPKIKTLKLPNSIVKIQDNAFELNEFINEVQFDLNSQLTYIGNKAFYFGKLRRFNLPNSVEFIGNRAFSFCEQLNEFVIQEDSNLQTIGHEALSKTAKLKKLFIPKNVEVIGNDAFSVTPNLKEIKVDEQNNHFTDINGVLYNKNINELIKYPSKSEKTTIIIPDSVEVIKQNSFDYSSNLNKVVFGKGVKEIEPFAFRDSHYIEEVELNEGLEKIGRLAFYNNISLKEITIPDSVTTYGINAFHGLQSLEKISFGKESKEFGKSVISGETTFLNSIIIKAKEINLTDRTFNIKADVKNKVKFTVYSEEAKSKLIEIGILPENIILLTEDTPTTPVQPEPEKPEPELPVNKDIKGFTTTLTNIRVQPNSTILGTLEKGSLVEGSYEEGSNWVKFNYRGEEAYIYKPLISDKFYIEGFVSGTTNIRKSANGEIVSLAKYGEIVKGYISVDTLNWVKIDKGYIYKDSIANTIKLDGLVSGTTNLRLTPNGKIIGIINKAAYVEGVVNINNPNWIRIKYNNKDAYIYRSLLKDKVSVNTLAIGTLNVRQTPNGKILGTLKNGAYINGKVSVYNPNWIEFQYKGQRAYVYKMYVK